ncbi:MAG TPA: Sua5/YciO/YrdC/YwlC family protein, partial [Puia sp.]
EEYTDPEIIYEHFKNQVDIVVDGGPGHTIPSTIIDYTSGEAAVIRKGAGAWEE